MQPLNVPRPGESGFRGITRPVLRGVAAVALVLLLVGCSGGTAAPPAATPTPAATTAAGAPTTAPSSAATAGSTTVDACDFFTPDEVGVAYGVSRPFPKPSSDDLYAYCTYTAPGAPDIRIFVTKSGNAASYFNTAKANSGQAVSGVGDEAYWSTDSFLPGLYFLKGGVMAYLSGPATGPQDSIVQLGKLLASRM
jgi:uncharacterized protein DUF3558